MWRILAMILAASAYLWWWFMVSISMFSICHANLVAFWFGLVRIGNTELSCGYILLNTLTEAPTHKSKRSMEWFMEKRMHLLDWPINSPDQSPLRHHGILWLCSPNWEQDQLGEFQTFAHDCKKFGIDFHWIFTIRMSRSHTNNA